MLGSHNTFSYLPLKNWWMYPFNFMAKCQNKTLGEQVSSGVRYFDIRMKVNKKGQIELAHGLMTYRENIDWAIAGLEYFALRNDITARVVVEYNHRPKNEGFVVQRIIDYVDNTLRNHLCSHVKFHQIMTKWNEEVVKEYIKDKDFELVHKYSSVLGKKRYWTIPFFYAKKHNKKFKEDWNWCLENKNKVLMLDFV